MTENEFEILRICRSAELAYFLSEHSMDKPRFIQQWFKNKVKNDRQELTNAQIHTICSEWQLKQKIFYKKYKGFTDHHNKVIQSLQFLEGQDDKTRIQSACKLLESMKVTVVNGLDGDTKADKDSLPQVTQEGLVLIENTQSDHLDDGNNISDQLTIYSYTIDARRFHGILDIFKLHGFDIADKGKYAASTLLATKIISSAANPINRKATGFEHDRDKDWREELTAGNK